jgi:hypothetical protein
VRTDWDRPPLPSCGDRNASLIYEGVGRVLSQWKQVEVELGYLYGVFRMGYDNKKVVSNYCYHGSFGSRMKLLDEAAEDFLIRADNRQMEIEFDRLRENISGFSGRRNDIAHGVLRTEVWTRWCSHSAVTSGGPCYFLLPADYRGNALEHSNLPEYAYVSETLNALGQQLTALLTEIQEYGAYVMILCDSGSR